MYSSAWDKRRALERQHRAIDSADFRGPWYLETWEDAYEWATIEWFFRGEGR